jgi:hypothetical protein
VARDVWEGGRIATQEEIEREYRLAKQTLAMHQGLRETYWRRSRAAEIVLLLASVVFCATTFSSDQLFSLLALSGSAPRVVLGLASVAAFAASLVLLVVDWRGSSARHSDASARWSRIVARFREARQEDGSWPADERTELHRLYWEVSDSCVQIPDRKFNRLKARYLMKVELSKKIQAYPGAPLVFLWIIIRCSATIRSARGGGGAESDSER